MTAPLIDRLRLEAVQHFGSPPADELAALLLEAAEALAVELGGPAPDAPYCGCRLWCVAMSRLVAWSGWGMRCRIVARWFRRRVWCVTVWISTLTGAA